MHKLNSFSRVAEREYALSTGSLNLLYYDLPKDFHDEYRSYDAPRLCTILKGTKSVSVNQSQSFQYNRDQFVLLPPNSNIYMKMPEYTKALVYEFDEQMIEGVSQRVADTLEVDSPTALESQSFAVNSIDKRIEKLHTRMQEILREQEACMDFLIDLTGQELVFELLRNNTCQSIISNHRSHPISKAIRIMNSPMGLKMTLAQVAEEVGLSQSSFSQKFKAATQLSPKQYLTQVRLQSSKRSLNKLSVTDAAYEAGYDNISHYIRLFKNAYGLTPKQYQRSLIHGSQ
ncbi:helix-turn-helix transcriptional regulator [Vibrio barjaei]|jgi:AraC-like DNA-binding protein|uniref:Helix-turn-helix transcriptional regulator n=1 Tax=Vibrio barjaei TaxID=1676683 RepID=A0ABW7IM36_9VIBR|nr:AraC family transcriptional regulator [Vibrio barjaei]MCY9872680.1 AraC family transcriptional regulator [Vibrio barjaei]